MDEETRHKAAFITQNGVYEWLRLPFGLRNAPVSFQQIMTQVLRGLNWKFVLVYVDDILVFSRSFEEHLGHLEQVFNRLRDANLTLKPSKCEFAVIEVKYLGHIISKEGIKADPEKTEAISTFPVPTKQKDVRSFLGLCGFYRRFVDSFAKIAVPLTNLLKKENERKFKWTVECQTAFDKLKLALQTPPVLAYPDMNKPFVLTCDASNSAIGFVLGQLDSQKMERVIAYGGRSLSKSQQGWNTTEKECFAVVEGVKTYHTYLAHRKFTIYTDHSALLYLMDQKRSTGKLTRWAMELQGYTFDIVHRKGCNNRVADALSRRTYPEQPDICNRNAAAKVECVQTEQKVTAQETREYIEVELFYDDYTTVAPVHPVVVKPELGDLRAIVELQQQCPDFADLYRYVDTGELPDDNSRCMKVQSSAQDYTICNGLLYKWFQKRVRVENGEKWIKQLCLPRILRESALLAFHDSHVGGAHLGVERVYTALSLKYFWPKMHQSIENYIRSCDRCQRIKTVRNKKPPLNPLPVSTTFERWHIDFLKLSKTKDGYQYVLLLVDSFSKWTEAFAMKTQEASEVAQILFREIIARYGAMRVLVSDKGQNFMSKLVQALCEMMNITKHSTSSYHPQTNGLVERTNSTIIQSLRAYCDKDQKNWPGKLPGILMALRNSPSTQSTEYHPSQWCSARK